MFNNNKNRMFSWMNPNLEVRETEKYGKGVFACKELEKNEILAIFGGFVMRAVDEANLQHNCDGGLQISEDFVISSGEVSEDTDFFNHSCTPNSGFHGQIVLVSMKKINKGEEVTFDYAMVLHRTKGMKAYNIKCSCGSKNCRQVITDNDWKIRKLQKKYAGYFQFFINSKIKKINNKKNA